MMMNPKDRVVANTLQIRTGSTEIIPHLAMSGGGSMQLGVQGHFQNHMPEFARKNKSIETE